MAKDAKNEESSLQRYHMEQRRAVNNAYAALEGEKNIQSFSAFTFEDAVDLQIEAIEGKGTQIRPNQLERVDRVEKELVNAVEKLKQVPPEAFLDKDENRDVNT